MAIAPPPDRNMRSRQSSAAFFQGVLDANNAGKAPVFVGALIGLLFGRRGKR